MTSSIRTRSSAASGHHSLNGSDDPYLRSSGQTFPQTPPRSTSTNTTPVASYSRGPLTGRPSSPKILRNAKGSVDSSSSGSHYSSTASVIRSELPILVGITILAFFVRFYKISQPSSIVFDEVHFGGFASKYINRKFFMDVHPPLAKLLIAGVARMAGFDGKFDFKDIGREYLIGDHTPVPYVAMRSLPAILGVAVVPLAYLTLRALSLRGTTALVGALLVLFDNALTTQSRLILLDSFLVFFTAATAYCWVEFCNEERRKPFALTWWAWLAACGFFLGCVVSTKWVGLFTIATIGVATVMQLWSHLGNVRQPMSVVTRHVLARASCLIGLPIFVYLLAFAVHLGVLNRSGEGDGFMSSAFQHTLVGHGMKDTFADVALGSTITIRHVNTQGGLLHSHLHNYPSGSGQQQITLYPHDDENNEWFVIQAPGPDDPPTPTDENGVPKTTAGPHEVEKYAHRRVTYLTHGMEVRLVHRKSSKRLHSHESNRPPITEADFQNEVTGYGFPGFAGDANDNWRVEIEHGAGGDAPSSSRVRALRTVFRLRHTLTGCYLFSHKIPLPDWGFGQQEVTCNKQPSRPNSLWFVETSTHPRISLQGNKNLATDDEGENDPIAVRPGQTVNYLRPGFLSKFWELQKVMWVTNAGLTDRHAYDSRPKTWPTLRRGINFWSKEHRQVYLIGNPFVWWGSTVAIAVFLGARALLMLRQKRGAQDLLDSTIVFYDRTATFLFIGYAMHFFPFFLMSRQLFIHHYLPALYFAVLMLALLFDLLTAGLRPRYRLAAASAMILVAVMTFSEFSPITYAQPWTLRSCERARWMKPWDFNCREFPQDIGAYKSFPPGVHTVSASVAAGAKADNATASANLGAPQPGQHAFEDAPKKAAESGGAGGAAAPAVAQQKQGGNAPQAAANNVPAAAAPVAPAAPAPAEGEQVFSIQPIHQPGDGVMPQQGQAPGQAQAQPPAPAPAAQQPAKDAQGLDQEQVEQMMLEGTQGVGKQHAGGASSAVGAPEGPSGIARIDEAENELPPV